MHKKLNISKWLMYASVLLIVLFQFYWLRKVYQDSYRSLQREIGVVLREALVKDQLQVIFGDSALTFLRKDTFVSKGNRIEVIQLNDSTKKTAVWNGKDTIRFNREVFGNSDSGRRRMIPQRFMAFESENDEIDISSSLVVSLPVSEPQFEAGRLNEKYSGILKAADLPHRFTIKKKNFDSLVHGLRLRQNSGGGRQGFNMVMVECDFGNPIGYIMQKMIGQLALAVFMTGMIILAFRFMYKSMKEQQKMSTLKDEFISNMTHELKTPVATVSVAIEALKNFNAMDNPARTKEYLDISSAELNRLSMLIDKVLRINMFEAEKLHIDFETVDLRDLSNEVIQATQLQAEKLNATLHWQAPAEAMPVKGDKLHLMSVLYNLLDNALKYRDEKPEIFISLQKEGDKITWQVKDNGPGIAAEYRKKIFEKFFRVPTGDRHDVKGYGLGLSYVHEIVQQHGGTIEMQSEPGKGCNFIVKLPAAG
jgi:two-component system, OmpR family, phosphate regulon sensor histidine kinase PhoR